ncbi:hypothetical protein R3W88_004399 [Solanum pinnatisectum]|uniref:Uncharacterized protein n=1 Tax=Solanum pinnatisectum TaxID=50273 RepID=A0AAV9K955_9SOLN|nr:hypothetical protein R3W88_004399 [Solanum pinnatisectum]
MNVVSAIEVVADKDMRVPIEERMPVETLAAKLMNFDADFRSDYVETVNALFAKPSIEEPPVLELKQLPSHLRYVFLGSNNTLPVILAANLNKEQVKEAIMVFRRYKRAIESLIICSS